MIFEILISMFTVLILIWFYKYKNMEKHLTIFKGPTPLPFIGNFLHFYSNEVILPSFLKLHQRYGGVLKLSLGSKIVFLSIADVNFLKFLMSSTKLIDKSVSYKYLHKWLGYGLLTSTGEKWKARRKLLTPAYHFKILEQFVDVFETYSSILVEKFKNELDKPSVNIYPYVTLCSLDIICATSMGTKVNAQEDLESEYVKYVKEMTRILIERATNPFKSNDTLYAFSTDYNTEIKALQILHDYTNNVIESRTEEIMQERERQADLFEQQSSANKKKTLLDLLINHKIEKQSISNEDIREEVDTFMFEGHDTTSAAMNFGLYCIANNQEIQEKITEELHKIFEGDFIRPTTYKDLQEMKYLEKVIKETLRMYPSVPIFARLVTENTRYENIILPKGLNIIINAYCLHRNPTIYPNPETFDPERFNVDEISKRSPYAYVPFSAGSRNCIGQKFAMLEMKAVISKVLKSYKLLPSQLNQELILVPETILKSKSGVNVRLTKRM